MLKRFQIYVFPILWFSQGPVSAVSRKRDTGQWGKLLYTSSQAPAANPIFMFESKHNLDACELGVDCGVWKAY